MSLFFRHRQPETRALSFQEVWGTGTAPGMMDAVRDGLRLAPVYAAVSLIADLVSTSPLWVYREASDGTLTRLPSQPSIVRTPSPFGNRIDWVHQGLASMLLRGNAYGYVTSIENSGWPSQAVWLHPDEVTVAEEQSDWLHTPTYYWRGHHLDPRLVVHIPAFTLPGSVVGLSPLGLFKMQIETGMKANQYGLDWFENGANPSGKLTAKARTLTPEQIATAKRRFKEAVSKRDVFVTGSDWDYSALSVSQEESQFLATIKATANQIAAIYRVAPEDIGGETGSSLTYKTLSQDATKLTTRTLRVWATRLAAALTDMRPRPQFAAFDLTDLSRGDRASEVAANAAALKSGEATLDEIRADNNKPPLTPEQIAFWQEHYNPTAPAAPPVAPEGAPA